jgi:hypothetical protein
MTAVFMLECLALGTHDSEQSRVMTGVRYGEGAGSEQHKVCQTSAVRRHQARKWNSQLTQKFTPAGSPRARVAGLPAERLRAYTSEKVAVVRVFDYKVERRKKEEHEDCLRLLNITGGSPGVMRN